MTRCVTAPVSVDSQIHCIKFSLLLVLFKLTRITDHTATLIDNIFFNPNEYVSKSGNMICDLTDDLPNFLVLNTMHWSANDVFRYTRDYSTFSGNDLLQDFEEIEWESVLKENGTSHDFDSFYNITNAISDKHISLKIDK